jgi:hypothetical protein
MYQTTNQPPFFVVEVPKKCSRFHPGKLWKKWPRFPQHMFVYRYHPPHRRYSKAGANQGIAGAGAGASRDTILDRAPFLVERPKTSAGWRPRSIAFNCLKKVAELYVLW